MFDWFKPNDVLWLIPAAPLLACLWIVVVGHVVRRQYAHRPVVLALTVSFAAALYLLLQVVPSGFAPPTEHSEHEVTEHVEAAEHGSHAAHAPVSTAITMTVYLLYSTVGK